MQSKESSVYQTYSSLMKWADEITQHAKDGKFIVWTTMNDLWNVAPDTQNNPAYRLLHDIPNAKIDPKWITGKLAEEIFEHVARHELVEPTFVMGFPVDTSPLVRAHRDLPGVVEKWDLYVDGFELATGYSELIDPVVQRDRLVEQATLGAKGDLEAMQVDEDFLRAMEFAMPPTGGMGMGVDRLLMAITGLGIRETILFPLVKPEVD